MLTLNDGRNELWQWDTGRTLAVDADCSQVHFSNKVFGRSIDVDVVNGAAIIPDVLLQTDNDLNVWAFVGTAENGYTKISKTFKVNRRNKPADYVFTPVDQTTIAEIAAIAQSVRDDADNGLFDGAPGADGQDGVGIQSVEQTTTSTEDGGANVVTVTRTDGTSSTFQIKNGSRGQDATVDASLTQSGKAADAAVVGQRLSALSEEKVSLPKAEDGTAIPGTAGWYAVSDGAGGIKWVESAPSTGGGGETTTHGIAWNLVNVTSSNNAVSVADGASLVAVLTPADGYTLGDVTITMGGEVVTGAWNADTATVTIQSVTGDVIISCAGVSAPAETPLEATWVNGSQENGIVTVNTHTLANVFVEPLIDGINTATKIIFRASADYLVATPINQVRLFLYSDAEGQNFVGSWNLAQNAVAEGDTATQSVDLDTAYIIPAGYYVRVFMSKGYNPANFSSNANLKSYVTGGFVEFYAVSAGSAVEATSLSVDDDYAMNYGISTMSLVVDDMTSAEASNAGIDQTFANTVISSMNSWMKEYRGNINKIPLIIHTDQHGRLTSNVKPLFDLLNSKVNWYEVSKIMNLGDTVSDRWIDTDSAEPLLECTALEHTLECLSNIPFSKRMDVFGNHDTWYTNADGEDTVLTDFPHLSQYFKNIYARRTNNHGWFTVKDDYFNVKYVVISGFEYTTSRSTYRISTAQMKWLIGEMSKDDGYDIVVVSHVPLHYATENMTFPTGYEATGTENYRVSNVDTDALFAARKNKVSGTVTDSDGVEHQYDFSSCTTEVLCALHGHTHHDAYNYVGTNGLLSVSFDWFADNTMHFVLVDRVNRQLNVWKVDSTNTVQNYQVPMDKATE